MDLPRRRRPDQPSDLARRRLELLGVELGHVARGEPAATPVPPPMPVSTTGRHRAGSTAVRRTLVGELPVRRPHVAVVLLAVALALAATGWWVSASRPQEVRPLGADDRGGTEVLGDPAPSGPADGAPGATPSPAAATASAAVAASASVVVDVTGKVRRPGIVTLPSGSRVADAVESAGGARPGADLSTVNLARVLVDGEQVVVGLPPVAAAPGAAPGPVAAPTAGVAAGDPGGLVDLNTATMEQLDTLPGVGPVTAQAILDHRTEIGRFSDVEELLDVRGIGDARLADLRERVTVR